ncbi:MAG: glycosyltransferase family 9 protein [Candidatus Binatia bacterium]|nr:glycosyltransferase family 9 protein [Candidatus Binatia bacterium]
MNLRLARYIDRWVGLGICFVLWAAARLLSAGRLVPALFATTPPGTTPLSEPRRVLAIKFYGLGNIAMILPTLAAMKRDDPEVEIDFLTLPGNISLLEQSGFVTRSLTVEVSSLGDFIGSVIGLFNALRGGKYDAVLDFEQFMKLSGIFAFLSGAPARIGFNTEGQARGWLYSHRVAYADTDHMADIFMRLALPFGLAIQPAPHVRISVAASDRADALAAAGVSDGAGLVAMHVGTGPNYGKVALKRWSVERFARLADHLIETRGVRVVFTGVGEEEADLVREALQHMRHPDGARSLCDVLSVGALTGLLEAATFVVSNDTSVMHLTGLVETPVVAIFGATEPRIYGPRGSADLVFYRAVFCSPCLSNYNLKMSRCVDPVCMRQIEVAEVVAGIDARFPAAKAV